MVRGEAAHELAQAAETEGAFMIVVGARRLTVARRMGNLLTGSVAAHLAHHQPTPVLVVPATPSHTQGGR
ncbi:nucleotide-binding universal stress UspA family protein [Arthrobacter sp. CAN_A212]|uniref:universal stress protein n=1 Tax=Arthrobacter sp. CAN_A212 TaxID=2787719 RepID=UPI0018C94972